MGTAITPLESYELTGFLRIYATTFGIVLKFHDFIPSCSHSRISLESVGLVLDMGADTGVEWLRSSMGCISMVLTSCGRYWNGLGERTGESGMCTKVLVLMGVGTVGGLVGWGGNWCGVSGSS